MRKQKPTIKRVVAKLNEGVSGLGERQHRLVFSPPPPRDPAEPNGVLQCVKAMKFEKSPKRMGPLLQKTH